MSDCATSPAFVHVADAPSGSVSVKVCTYNVLAQHLASSSFFPYAKPYLRQAARRQRVLRAITEAAADVLFLQEVEQQDVWLVPQLDALGYATAFKQKTQRKRDGVMVAWRHAALECLACRSVEFECEPGCDPTPDEAAAFDAPLRTGGVALAVALRPRACPALVLGAGTTHVWWIPTMKRVKNSQIARTAALMEATAREGAALAAASAGGAGAGAAAAPVACALVLGADFNTNPGDEPYELATHILDFTSLADVVPAAARGCGCTNITDSFRGWLDHVMWKPLPPPSEDGSDSDSDAAAAAAATPRIVLESARALPELDDVTRETALPNSVHGSDHVPLVCVLAFQPPPPPPPSPPAQNP